jgi:hypothetical protein
MTTNRVGSGKHALARERVLRTAVLLMAASGLAVGCSDRNPQEPPPPDSRISSVSPASAVAGSPDLTIALTGSGFSSGVIHSQAVWRTEDTTTDLTTTIVGSAQLTAVVPAALLREPVDAQVYVENRDRVEGVVMRRSNEVAFTVVPAPPHFITIDSISPTSAVAGSPDLILSVVGSNFRSGIHIGSRVVWSTKDSTTWLGTTFVSGTQLNALVPADLLRDTVVAQVYVLTGDVMGDFPLDQSNKVPFTVTPAPPD